MLACAFAATLAWMTFPTSWKKLSLLPAAIADIEATIKEQAKDSQTASAAGAGDGEEEEEPAADAPQE